MNTIQTIKGLFFDFDGVITMEKEGTPTILSYISKVTHIPYEIIDKAYRPYNNDLLYGYITHKQMWKVFCDKIGYDIEYEVLEKESGGFLGLLGGKPAKIAVKLKEAEKEAAEREEKIRREFIEDVAVQADVLTDIKEILLRIEKKSAS